MIGLGMFNPARAARRGGAGAAPYDIGWVPEFQVYGGSAAANNFLSGFTEEFDTNSAVDTTGRWVAPATGWYMAHSSGFSAGGAGIGVNHQLQITTDTATEVFFESLGYMSSAGHSHAGVTNFPIAPSVGTVYRPYTKGHAVETALFNIIGFDARPDHLFLGYDGAATSGNVVTTWGESSDYSSAFNASTGVFTAPEDGNYFVSVRGVPSGGLATAEFATQLELNGTQVSGFYPAQRWYFNSYDTMGAATVIPLTAGDTLQVRSVGDTMFYSRFWGFMIPPAAELAVFRSGTIASPVNSFTAEVNTSGALNASTGIYTAPADGYYLAGFAAYGSIVGAGEIQSVISSNGSAYYARTYSGIASQTFTATPYTQTLTYLAAGQQIAFYGVNGTTTNRGFVIRVS